MSELLISLIQADLRWEDPDGNRTHFDQLLKEVPSGTDLVLLPETFNTGFPVSLRRASQNHPPYHLYPRLPVSRYLP